MVMPRYTCRESALMISPLLRHAQCAATDVLPPAVATDYTHLFIKSLHL
jgi:hypothetical protein